MKNKIGLLFSHLHVRENEMFKFDILEYCIDFYRNINKSFFIVVTGHGCSLPEHILNKIDSHFWENNIDPNQIGRGHPKFCIEGYKILKDNNLEKSIKLRASDICLKIDVLEHALSSEKILLSEQTSIQRGMIGDLFMCGPTENMLRLWTEVPWDYSKSGLFNLYDATISLSRKNNQEHLQFLKSYFNFINPRNLMWVDIGSNWDHLNSKPHSPFTESHLWGLREGYEHYGG